MHPVLFHIGSILIPAYGVSAAVGVLLALRTAGGALNGTQMAAAVLVVAGGLALLERNGAEVKDEAAHD